MKSVCKLSSNFQEARSRSRENLCLLLSGEETKYYNTYSQIGYSNFDLK